MKIKPEFKIGLATIASLAILYWGIQYLKGVNALRIGSFYYLKCQEIGSLAVSSHVKVNGYDVGVVRDIVFDYQNPQNGILVAINTESDFRIPRDSRFEVMADLLGTDNIGITLGTSSEYFTPGDTIQECPKAAGMLDAAAPIMTSVQSLMPKLDTLLTGVNVLINESRLQESLLEINTLSQHLNQTVNQLNALLRKDVPQLFASTEETMQNLDTITAQVKEAEVEKLLTNATAALENCNQVLSQLQQSDNSAGKLLTTTELHDQLSSAIASVDSLLTDLKAHPRRYINVSIFGRKDK